MSFVHLRVHSEYSFLRGACRLENLVLRAKELGMPAVALTDYGVLHGAVRFTELALACGIMPILGVEAVVDGLPAVLLVRSRQGWKNLLKLVNGLQLSHPQKNELSVAEVAACSEGLTVLLHTCGENLPPAAGQRAGTAHRLLKQLRPYCDELYLALEDAGLPGTERCNRLLAEVAAALGVPLAATHNVHYVLPEEDTIYRMVNCIRTGRPLAGARQAFLPGKDYSLLPAAEMRRRLQAYPQACANTLRIAEKCSFILRREEMHLPQLSLDRGEPAEAALRRLCREGMVRRGLLRREAERRLDRELAIISARGLAPYFLIVHDLVCQAKARGIPVGPGRGSAGGSLVAYLLGITGIDPLKHGLYFERFLSEDRAAFPDIDLDVCQRRREELLAYLKTRYGDGRVAQVSTFSTLGARAAVREVGKVLDVSMQQVAAVAEALPHTSGQGGIDAALRHFPEFQSQRLQDGEARAMLAAAQKLEGLVRHLSTHASGVILGAGDLAEAAPLCRGPSGEVLTQWDKDDVETMGFLKIDLLGSRNLTIIHDTLAAVKRRRGEAPAVEDIPDDDAETYAMLRRGESLGCFQLESAGMRRVLRLLAPRRLEDLIHLLSLYRPGPWESGMVERFAARRRGLEETVYPHPSLAPILAETYGVVLYQEQVMRIACEVAGYTPGEADTLRRELGRRQPARQDCHREKFVRGAVAKGLTAEEAEAVFAYLCRFAGYGFNKAHAAAYALVSYWTAYLKRHYPVEFYAALLSAGFGYYGMTVYVHEARLRGIRVLPPQINKSSYLFLPEGNCVRAALPLVRDVGGRGVAAILRARENGPFTSLQDFCRRVGRSALRRSALVHLVKAGAFDGLGLNRRQALAVLDRVLGWTARQPGQLSFWEWSGAEEVPDLPDYTERERAAAEEASLGIMLSLHPLQQYADLLAKAERIPLAGLPEVKAGQTVTVAAYALARSRKRLRQGGVMLTLFLSDESGFAEAVLYPAVYRRLLYRLDERMLLLTGKVTADGDGLVVSDALPLVVLAAGKGKGLSVSK